MSTSSPVNNSLLIIDRVEFVSKNLNDELLSVIHYSLNASFTSDGHIASHSVDGTKNETKNCQIPSLLSFSTIQPGGKLTHLKLKIFLLNKKFITQI